MESDSLRFIKYTCSPDKKPSDGLSGAEWGRLYEFAKMHSVLGVTFSFIDGLDGKEKPSLREYAMWAIGAGKIRKSNELLDRRSREIYDFFRNEGLRSCILKGQGTAGYYPDPSLRQCGDIDIWVDMDREKLLNFFTLKGLEYSNVLYHNCELKIFGDAKVEVHYHPSFMYSPRLDRRLQRYFRSAGEKQFSNFVPELGFCAPDTEFAAAYGIIHIFRHLFFEGIGLRQVVDLYYILKSLPGERKAQVMSLMSSLSLGRFTSALMWVLGTPLGLEREYLLCEPSPKYGWVLLREILVSGNFGRFDPAYGKIHGGSLPQRAYYKLVRVLRYIGFCPEEVFFSSLFKTWQLLWRKIHKFN